MKNYYSKMYGNIEPKGDLLGNILLTISEKKKTAALKKHILLMIPILLSTSILSAYSFVLLRDAFVNTGLFDYISLMFTDTSTVVENSGLFIQLIAESIPAFTLALLLLGVLLLLKVAQYMLKDIDLLNKINSHKHGYANI